MCCTTSYLVVNGNHESEWVTNFHILSNGTLYRLTVVDPHRRTGHGGSRVQSSLLQTTEKNPKTVLLPYNNYFQYFESTLAEIWSGNKQNALTRPLQSWYHAFAYFSYPVAKKGNMISSIFPEKIMAIRAHHRFDWSTWQTVWSPK